MTTVATGLVQMDEEEYHSHPALSSSGARKILPPGCPALFKYERDNPPPSKPHFDLGRAAHMLVLGLGAEIVEVDAPDWRTKAAQQARDTAYAEGKTPLLAADVQTVLGMAKAILDHPLASAIFTPDSGTPEQSAFWTDQETGVDCRARFDWLPHAHNGRLVVPDYKTTACAAPDAFARSCANYGYHQQSGFYLDAALALELAEDVAFVFVAQEKTPPYLISVVELDAEALRLGRALNRLAREVYADCAANDTWPGYSDDVVHIGLPGWAIRQHENLLETA